MSTRCNVKIEMGKTIIWFYRHYDGYFSETGADLYTKIAESSNFTQFVEAMLKDHYYEITDQKHGDIEYMYEFKWRSENRIDQIACKHIKWDGELGDFYTGARHEAVGGYCNFIRGH
mgnify:CR=1 FL=1